MPYEKVVLTDGMAVLFAVLEEPQETGPSEVETPQSDPRVLVAALTAASRVIAAGQVRRRQGPRDRRRAGGVTSGSACGVAGRGTWAPMSGRMPGLVTGMTHRSQTPSP